MEALIKLNDFAAMLGWLIMAALSIYLFFWMVGAAYDRAAKVVVYVRRRK